MPEVVAPRDREAFSRVVDSLAVISDRVEAAAPGVIYVRLDGLQRLYGGEARLVKALLGAAPEHLEPRIGVADGKFPAFVAASTGNADATIVPADVAGYLAPCAVDWLPLSVEVRDGLRRFGLHTMGGVAALREGQLLDQFGLDGRRAWRLCRGIDDSPVVPLKREEPVVEYLSLPFATTSLQVLRATIDTLLRRAYAHPHVRGRCPRRASLECGVSDAPSWAHTVSFKENIPDWERAAFIINHQVEGSPPPAPVEAVQLTLSGFTTAMGVQLSLLPTPHADREHRLLEAERRLRFRMRGCHALHRVVTVAPWHPAPGAARLADSHRPGGKGRHQAPDAADPGGGAGRPGPPTAGRTPAAAMVSGGPYRGSLVVRPLVAAGAADANLLPRESRRRQSVDGVSQPQGQRLVPAERLGASPWVPHSSNCTPRAFTHSVSARRTSTSC